MKKVKRIDYIDILKAIAIILVIIGHMSIITMETRKYIYSFHMPLFFICYGLTYKPKKYNIKMLKKIAVSKFKRIYIPYILWTLFFSTLTIQSLFYILYGSHNTLALCTNSHLWFFPCFLVSTLLFELINAIFYHFHIKNKFKRVLFLLIIVLSVSLSVMLPYFSIYNYPLCLNPALMGLAFICIGRFIRLLLKYFQIEKLNLGILIIIFIVLIVQTYTYKFNKLYYVSMATNYYGNVFYFLLTAVIGSLAMIVLSIILDKILYKKIKKALIFLGQNTLAIIPIHHTIIMWFEELLFVFKIPLPFSLCIPIITVLVLLISSFVVKFINKYVPALNGRFPIS